jgi:hypothetical protein
MTKKDLAKKMKEFIDSQNDTLKDEWWGTDRILKGAIIEEFAETLGITEKQIEEAT